MANTIEIKGRVVSGMGRGRFFMSQKGYRVQFKRKLGMNPYTGTLNLKLIPSSLKQVDALRRKRPILIRGFKSGEKDFGDVVCYRADLNGMKCAIVMPKRSTHTATLELISRLMLRKRLKLKNGMLLAVRA